VSTTHAWLVPYRYPAPADLENWLEDHARRGQVLTRVGQWSVFRMTLQDGGPATYRYVVDVQGRPRPDYLTTYQDFGWEHLGRTSNIHLWRRAYGGARPEAFTDADSLRARSRRFEIPVAVVAALCAVGAVVQVVVGFAMDATDLTEHVLTGGMLAVMAVGLGLVARRIWRQRDR